MDRFQIKEDKTIPWIFIEHSENLVGYFTDEHRLIIHWGLKELVMSKEEATNLIDMINTLISEVNK